MKLGLIGFTLLFLFFGIGKGYSQVLTAGEIRNELNSLWNSYEVFQIPKMVESNYSDGLRQFGDRFWGIMDGSGDENMQIYYFAGRANDLFVMFIDGDFAEYMVESNPEEYFFTNETNKELLRRFIKRWQTSNEISGNFF
jgi:hypothetical protein